MSDSAPFSALLLAAGRSTRMRRDKALLELDGLPLWRRQRDLLAEAGAAEIFLSARPAQDWARQAAGFSAVLHDAFTDGGPLVGIAAGLERAAHPHLLVLAIDLPAMSVRWLQDCRDARRSGRGVVGRHEGFFEPLAAVYPKTFLSLAWPALVRGEYALQPLLARAADQELMQVREIGDAEAAWFANLNEPPRT